ncbi:hypothetical protein [Paracoccus saliphilus]|uniref:Uncharacterized protein n=1 Tax=Paracoccus saliphilus TaxID=405559 RepID=A0AA45W8C1_9RHOB|nr:hypothetical protein [Paracoccus saliphilus]WCR02940.1 hypothetical protein JHX88_19385 [Paracoccus saliphilus]SIT15895.1 hypothetical protein SAMN05421772_12716 [Paracoccus saliphilus]
MSKPEIRFDAWNPGLKSELPSELLPEVTLYRPENSETRYREAKQAAEFCGLRPEDMIAFKPERLAIHDVLIRVTTELFVPDGPNYEDLGINLRNMASRILDGWVHPEMPALQSEFSELRSRVEKNLAERLDRDIFQRLAPREIAAKTGFLEKLFGKKKPQPAKEPFYPELVALSEWRDGLDQIDDPFEHACIQALLTVVGGIVGQRGRLMADKDLVVTHASNLVCNSFGSRLISSLIEPIFLKAVEQEGYRLLPYQSRPFVMNVKGASAAGKSTIRPLQLELAERLGVDWTDFALVSPDYWRKFLLDYDSLGENFKYAAMMTGHELEIIDKKLDAYMEEKASNAQMPHLLIDRFRFDSFRLSTNQQTDGRLLSRFGHTVFIFFIITSPTETVERAWTRGRETGRYKAVDDLLFHNVEAYTGMPELFLTWVSKEDPKVHFEFLDNDVAYGKRPRTVAFGWNGEITILDPDCMRRMNDYKQINVDATRPEEVYLDMAQGDDILATFIERIPKVTFIDRQDAASLAQFSDGDCQFANADFLGRTGLTGFSAPEDIAAAASPIDLERERHHTLGAW